MDDAEAQPEVGRLEELKAVATCALCKRTASLRDSHIVPRFVLAGIKEESLTGFLRSLDKPSARIQDAFKQKLLCGDCEKLLSGWETRASRQVFEPLRHDSNSLIHYDACFSRFALSVLWRVLVWRSGPFLAVSPEFESEIGMIEQEWRGFILGEQSKPGRASCHAVVLAQDLALDIERSSY